MKGTVQRSNHPCPETFYFYFLKTLEFAYAEFVIEGRAQRH